MSLKYRRLAIAVVAGFSLASGIAIFTPMVSSAQPQEVLAASRERAATFAIANMTCAMCPITVRTAMKNVDGVKSVQVDFDAKTATVTFDPSRATLKDIMAASTNAGYPATVQQ